MFETLLIEASVVNLRGKGILEVKEYRSGVYRILAIDMDRDHWEFVWGQPNFVQRKETLH